MVNEMNRAARRAGEFYGRNKKAIGYITGGIAAIFLVGGVACNVGKGERIFDGKIGGQRVTYEEGSGLFAKENRMTVRNGRELYTLIDSEDSTGIDWQLNNCPRLLTAIIWMKSQ